MSTGGRSVIHSYSVGPYARLRPGAGAFVGTNSSLVAPVKIGNGAYTGPGSVTALVKLSA